MNRAALEAVTLALLFSGVLTMLFAVAVLFCEWKYYYEDLLDHVTQETKSEIPFEAVGKGTSLVRDSDWPAEMDSPVSTPRQSSERNVGGYPPESESDQGPVRLVPNELPHGVDRTDPVGSEGVPSTDAGQ